ncbi:tRNA (adenine(58)-N(1))-methyltransferase, mitochondrial-like [Diadema setosum]|uniref:tRNA (adenine(58)-N(1))-methyltransferase, mitochondrial-like n=1 Tax=Diadema setosum TaxID=31175 RepID=UPI003B3AC42D
MSSRRILSRLSRMTIAQVGGGKCNLQAALFLQLTKAQNLTLWQARRLCNSPNNEPGKRSCNHSRDSDRSGSNVGVQKDAGGGDNAEERSSYLEARRRSILGGRRILSPLQRVSGMLHSAESETSTSSPSQHEQEAACHESRGINRESDVDVGVIHNKNHDKQTAILTNDGRQDDLVISLPSYPPLVDGEYILVIRENLKRQEKLVRLLELNANHLFKSKFGNIRHADIIGHPSGSVFLTNMDIELMVRRPSLEEYVLYMRRGPVISYPKDCCTMLMMIDASPGDTIIEAGSGSGAMTLFLSRAVGHSGRVHSFDREEPHQKLAVKNFKNWRSSWDISHKVKWPENVTFYPSCLENCRRFIGDLQVDGAIIDMEEAWRVMPTMASHLKVGKAMAIYTANLTQVIDVAEIVRKEGLPLVMETVLEVSHKSWVVNAARRYGGAILHQQNVADDKQSASSGEQYMADQVPKYLARPHHVQESHTAFLVRMRRIRSSTATFKV